MKTSKQTEPIKNASNTFDEARIEWEDRQAIFEEQRKKEDEVEENKCIEAYREYMGEFNTGESCDDCSEEEFEQLVKYYSAIGSYERSVYNDIDTEKLMSLQGYN